MSKHILASFENSSSSFKSIKNIHLSNDFYDTIYVGRFFSRYSVVYNNQPHYAYVLKSDNPTTCRFKDDVKTILGFKLSPFPSFEFFDEELLSYEDKKMGVYYDIILAQRIDRVGLFNISNISSINYDILQSLVVNSIWIIRNLVVVDGFDLSQIYIVDNRAMFDFNYRNNLFNGEESTDDFLRKLALSVVSAYFIYFNQEDKLFVSNILNFIDSDIDREAILLELQGISCDKISFIIEFYINGGDLKGFLESLESLLELDFKCAESIFKKSESNIDFYDSRLFEIVSDKPCEQRIIVKDRQSGKYGFIDSCGNRTSEMIYDSVEEYYESIAVVSISGEMFAIDNFGKTLFRNGYTSLEWLGEVNRFIAKSKGRYILLSRDGEVICDRDYSWIGEFSYGRAVVENSVGLKGYIDIDGREIVAAIYDDIVSFDDGMGRVFFDDNWYGVTLDGVLIKEF